MKIKIAFIDADNGRSLGNFTAQPHSWTWSRGSAETLEESMAFALQAYLELSKCGGATVAPSLSSGVRMRKPFIYKARELRPD